MKSNILIVEDEEDLRSLVKYNLQRENFEVLEAESGEAGLTMVERAIPDLILLDLMLPGRDGFEICRILKREKRTSDIPIIMMTARGEEADVVMGLELGAEDYIVKPFSPRVLCSRVKAVLRRHASVPELSPEDVLSVHDMVIHPGRHEVRVKDSRVNLTATEFRMLHFLARRPGWVFTRYQIVDAVHGEDYPVTERSVDVQMVSLRRKLKSAGKYIETVRSVGYRFRD